MISGPCSRKIELACSNCKESYRSRCNERPEIDGRAVPRQPETEKGRGQKHVHEPTREIVRKSASGPRALPYAKREPNKKKGTYSATDHPKRIRVSGRRS